MSDEKGENLVHGFDIHAGDHQHALSYIESHMSPEQLKDMVHRAESGHSAHFMVTHNGVQSNFKLIHQDGKLVIHHAHHI
ncbi:MAG: hypothetical protein PHT16_01765 [Candidatus Pacebacteria bacterium]|nr:hypothetical protein [Candidatus Paceibacterota bacterium]